MDGTAQPISGRPAIARSRLGRLEGRVSFLMLAVAGICLPLLDDSYMGVVATRACIYWILISGLNLVVGYAGQIAINDDTLMIGGEELRFESALSAGSPSK